MRAVRIVTKKFASGAVPQIGTNVKIVDAETGVEINAISCDIQIRRDDFITAVIEIPVEDIDLIAMVTKWKLEGKA